MRCKIFTYAVVALSILLNACVSSFKEKGIDVSTQSIWQLDEKSHLAILHHCVDVEFTETPAKFILEKKGENLLLNFNGLQYIWVAPVNNRHFYSRQVMKTSSAGRFCGFQTEISIYFSLDRSDPNLIKGVWRATTCEYCPQINFVAYRIN
jgi:hypothetical protein